MSFVEAAQQIIAVRIPFQKQAVANSSYTGRETMKKILLLHALFFSGALSAQESPAEGFSLNSKSSLQFNQIALSNWAPGGESSLALNGSSTLDGRYNRGVVTSQLYANWLVGLFKTEDLPIRKSQDHLTIVALSKYHFTPDFAMGLLADLTTQVAPSYVFDQDLVQALNGDPDKGIKTGDFLSPGYIELGYGFQYVKPKSGLDFIIAPVIVKQTVVLDEDVRTLGLYGNDGKTVRSQLGATVRIAARVPLMENVVADNKLKFFADYGDQNVDTSLLLSITGKINKMLSASVHATLLYDSDVDTDLAKPGKQEKVQIREVLGLSLTYAFQR